MSGDLVVAGVTVTYGQHRVLDDVSLTVPSGALGVVLGPSGSGKTTLLRTIAGFLQPSSGEVSLGRRLLTGPRTMIPPERRGIGVVPQEGALFPHLTVAENIGFGLDRSAVSQARIRDLLARIDLAGAGARLPGALSGGQQQRVSLARALAPCPDFIVLDEPFAALDAHLRGRMRDLLRDLLTESGGGALLVTHDQAEALSTADCVTVLREGRVRITGTPEHVYCHPGEPGVAESTGEVVILPAQVVARDRVMTCVGEITVAGTPAGTGAWGRVWVRPEQISLTVLPPRIRGAVAEAPERTSDAEAGPIDGWRVARVAFYGHDADIIITAPASSAPILRARVPAPVSLRPGQEVLPAVRGVAVFEA